MNLSGRYRRYRLEVAPLAIVAGAAFVVSALSIVALGILGGLRAINVDPAWWPFVTAGWGVGAIAAFAGSWMVRRILKTIRWFEYDADTLRYDCVGSRRAYIYRRPEVSKIMRYQPGGVVEWRIVFGDKQSARLSSRVENCEELVNALIGDSPRTGLASRLVNGTIFERNEDLAGARL